jgi:hypothetical protein
MHTYIHRHIIAHAHIHLQPEHCVFHITVHIHTYIHAYITLLHMLISICSLNIVYSIPIVNSQTDEKPYNHTDPSAQGQEAGLYVWVYTCVCYMHERVCIYVCILCLYAYMRSHTIIRTQSHRMYVYNMYIYIYIYKHIYIPGLLNAQCWWPEFTVMYYIYIYIYIYIYVHTHNHYIHTWPDTSTIQMAGIYGQKGTWSTFTQVAQVNCTHMYNIYIYIYTHMVYINRYVGYSKHNSDGRNVRAERYSEVHSPKWPK